LLNVSFCSNGNSAFIGLFGHPYTDILIVDYYSNGRTLNAILWFCAVDGLPDGNLQVFAYDSNNQIHNLSTDQPYHWIDWKDCIFVLICCSPSRLIFQRVAYPRLLCPVIHSFYYYNMWKIALCIFIPA
jgi:hypothetical protein